MSEEECKNLIELIHSSEIIKSLNLESSKNEEIQQKLYEYLSLDLDTEVKIKGVEDPEMKEKVENLKNDLLSSQDQNEKISNDLLPLVEQQTILEEQIRQEGIKHDFFESQIQEKKSKIEEMDNEILSKVEECKILEGQITELSSSLTSTKSELLNQNLELDQLTRRLETIESDLENAKNNLEGNQQKAQSKKQELESKENQLKEELKTDVESADLEKEIEEKIENINKLELELEAKRCYISEYSEKIVQLDQQLSELEGQKSQLLESEAKNKVKMEELGELKQEQIEVGIKKKELDIESKFLTKQIEDLKKQSTEGEEGDSRVEISQKIGDSLGQDNTYLALVKLQDSVKTLTTKIQGLRNDPLNSNATASTQSNTSNVIENNVLTSTTETINGETITTTTTSTTSNTVNMGDNSRGGVLNQIQNITIENSDREASARIMEPPQSSDRMLYPVPEQSQMVNTTIPMQKTLQELIEKVKAFETVVTPKFENYNQISEKISDLVVRRLNEVESMIVDSEIGPSSTQREGEGDEQEGITPNTRLQEEFLENLKGELESIVALAQTDFGVGSARIGQDRTSINQNQILIEGDNGDVQFLSKTEYGEKLFWIISKFLNFLVHFFKYHPEPQVIKSLTRR